MQNPPGARGEIFASILFAPFASFAVKTFVPNLLRVSVVKIK
jgi:hypothetical protein